MSNALNAAKGILSTATSTTLSTTLNTSLGASVASSATLNLDSVTGNLIHVTGTSNITGITLAPGAERTLIFDGVLTLTNGSSLVIPGGLSIPTSVNDMVIIRGDSGGVVRVIDYIKANGQLVSRAMNSVAKGTQTTGTQTFDFSLGSAQSMTVGGVLTIAFSNWPTSGNLGMMLVKLTNGGSATVTMPSINWIKPDDGKLTTVFATYMTSIGRSSLQTSGIDQMLIWTDDAGATLYGKLL